MLFWPLEIIPMVFFSLIRGQKLTKIIVFLFLSLEFALNNDSSLHKYLKLLIKSLGACLDGAVHL